MSATLGGPGWREDVTDRVEAVLKARVHLVSGRVLRGWVWPVNNDERPALLLYAHGDIKTLRSMSGGVLEFGVVGQIVVKLRCAGRPKGRRDGYVQTRDVENLARAVERAILTAPELVGPVGGVFEAVERVQTQLSTEQRGPDIEGEGTMIFDARWAEVFEMAEPDTSECVAVTFTPRATLIPTP